MVDQKVQDRYKSTEVGIIPRDWDLLKLGDIFEFKNGLNKEKKYFGQGTPIVNYTDVYKKRGLTANDIKGKVTVSKKELKAYEVRKNDVFFTRTSETTDEIGIASVILEDLKETVFSGFVLRARPNFNKLDTQYKKYCFSTEQVRKEIVSKSSYTTRALTNGKLLSEVLIPIPPMNEQKKIAKQLNDLDSLIETLEKLISKKRNIKQGTLHQLLSRKKRLNGFSDKWEIRNLGDCVTIRSGESPSKFKYKTNGIPYYKVEQLNNSEKFQIETPYFIECENPIPRGSIIFPKRGASILLNKVRILNTDSYMDTNLMTLTTKEELDNEFLYYYILFIELWRIADTTSIPQINNKHIVPLKISMPSLKEQRAIAQILSDMDSEIEMLEMKLQKYKLIKEGAMVDLLSGKVRMI